MTFPNGNTVKFPPLQKNGESTGSIRVALNGAAGLEAADFQIAIVAPELELPSGLNVTRDASRELRRRAGAPRPRKRWSRPTTAGRSPATRRRCPTSRRGSAGRCRRRNTCGSDRTTTARPTASKPSLPDQQILVSPLLQVGAGPLTIAFQHRFAFESRRLGRRRHRDQHGRRRDLDRHRRAGFYNGVTNAATSAPIGASRPAFVNRSAGWPNFANASLNLGTTYANQTVRIRFRIGADESTGAPGWDIDNIVIGGLDEHAVHVAGVADRRLHDGQP